MFIYKNTKNGKNDVIISHETQLCSQKELLHNASNKLIYTNSYESIKKQLEIINNIEKTDLQSEYENPLSITYNDETLNINSNGLINTQFENGNLIITNN